MMKKKVVVIGSGFAGLSAATQLADNGFDVTVLEKNESPGGRARVFESEGFRFDMGPSWYWMPDVFDRYFETFGRKTTDYYDLVRLDPSYKVIFGNHREVSMPAGVASLRDLFEQMEPGCGEKFDRFMTESEYKYRTGIGEFVWKPSLSLTEFMDFRLLTKAISLDLFSSFGRYIRKFFTHEDLIKIMEFPILFLGATPGNTPALYSLMNYAEMALGTWYPMGGMYRIVEGMVRLAKEKGVKIRTGSEVISVGIEQGAIDKVFTIDEAFSADVVVGAADYHHIESALLPPAFRNYSESYWEKRVMAPSSLIFYLGVGRKVSRLTHHNLFFDEDFGVHADEIYTHPQWPSKPLFYVSAPSVTDPEVAPEGCENLFILMPVAPGLEDSERIQNHYFNTLMERLETYAGHGIREHLIYKRSYSVSNFREDYHAFRGNAYGLANTLKQTAIFKPSVKNKHLSNLYYTGQLTVPGPGVPPSLISGLVVAEQISKTFGGRVRKDLLQPVTF